MSSSKYEPFFTSAGSKATVHRIDIHVDHHGTIQAAFEWRVDVPADPEDGTPAYYYTCKAVADVFESSAAVLRRSEPFHITIQVNGKGRWKPIVDFRDVSLMNESPSEQHITAIAAIFSAIQREIEDYSAADGIPANARLGGVKRTARYWQKLHKRLVAHTLCKQHAYAAKLRVQEEDKAAARPRQPTEGPSLGYVGDVVILPGVPDGHLRIEPAAPAKAKVRPQVQVMAFEPRPDDDSAAVTVSIQYQGGSGDILRGRHWRDGGARTWDHIHWCHSSAEFQRAAQSAATQDVSGDFWEDLYGDELLGPGSAGLERWVWPADDDFVYFSVLPAADEEGIRPETARFYATQDTDAIIAAADRAVLDHWQHHPSPCRMRELEVDIRGEAAVRAGPILRPLIEAADDAIDQAKLTHAQACGSTITRTIYRHDDCEAGTGYHVTLRRDGDGAWHIYDVTSDGGPRWVDTGDDYVRHGHDGDHVSIPRSRGRYTRLDIVQPDDA